jgi:hypothetical protein
MGITPKNYGAGTVRSSIYSSKSSGVGGVDARNDPQNDYLNVGF